MPNNILDSFQISGSVYDLKDKNSPSITELTQQEYDNLPSSAKTSNTLFLITDATPIDVSNYWTSAQTQSAITAAVSGKASQSDLLTVSGQVANKQDTLVSGTNIKTINNESILGSGNIDIQGGGSTYSAGRGISITNDTISFNLPISAGTGSASIQEGYVEFLEGSIGTNAHSEGYRCKAQGSHSHAEGALSVANGTNSHAEGRQTLTNNESEHSSGQFNVSNKANTTFGDSGNTLFSVGNGTANNARHNAFEIRQNGDIYITKDGSDVKLQDQLGGGITSGDVESMISAATSGYTERFAEDEEVTAAALNVLNNKFGGLKLVKLTQAEYTALTTKDPNTLYIITNTVV